MRARLEQIDADPVRAREFLAQARRFFEDAERDTTHAETAVVLYWNTCIRSMDAILTASGVRVGSGEDSHAVRIETTRGIVGEGYADLFERLDEWRRERHDVSYAAIRPSAASVAAIQADASDVLSVAHVRLAADADA